MIEVPAAPASETEKQAFRWVAGTVAFRLVLWVVAQAAAAHNWRAFAESAGVYFTALAMFAVAFWAGLRTLRLLSDSEADGAAAGASAPFDEPAEWTPILDRIPNVAALDPADRQRLGRLVQRFLRYVSIEGCGGLVVTDAVRLTIAAEAALLALNLPAGCLGPVRTVLVYPTAFVPERFAWVKANAPPAPHAALGESWDRGTVILAWDDVLRGVEDPDDGHNVVLHEFAHQLDSAGGKANGVPSLGSTHRYASWTRMLERNFARFTREVRRGRPSVLDPYAATNEAEFFAVATEVFFERPRALRRQYPELFAELQRYYRQDPSLRARSDQPQPPT